MWLFVRYLVALYSPPFWEWHTAPIICSIVHLWNTTPFCVENNYLAGGRKLQLEVFKSDFLRSSANKVWTLPNQGLLESQQKKTTTKKSIKVWTVKPISPEVVNLRFQELQVLSTQILGEIDWWWPRTDLIFWRFCAENFQCFSWYLGINENKP